MKKKLYGLVLVMGLFLHTSCVEATDYLFKTVVGIGITTGFGYALWRLYNDMIHDHKRYAQTANYLYDNQGRLTSDTFTVIGLGYLTYQSGLYTLEAMKDLVNEQDDEQKPQS
jgi:hypothetical protein